MIYFRRVGWSSFYLKPLVFASKRDDDRMRALGYESRVSPQTGVVEFYAKRAIWKTW